MDRFGHSEILHRSSFVMLFTYFDSLLADLLHNYFKTYPKMLEGQDLSLSLSDLMASKNIEEARDFLINKNIEGVMYKNLESQIDYFKSRLGVSCKKEFLDWTIIDEAKERRNILVHNNGEVNRRYIQKYKDGDFPSDLETFKEGDIIKIDKRYFLMIHDEMLISGLIFIQECWRSWHKDDINSADSELINICFNLLKEERWVSAQRIAKYGRSCEVSDDAHRYVIDFNYYQTLKWQGNTKELNKELDNLDLSSLRPVFILAYHTLKSDRTNFYKALRVAVGAEDIEKEDLKEWPLFREIRNDANYNRQINKIFRENKSPSS